MKFINALSISLRNEFIICRNMQLIRKLHNLKKIYNFFLQNLFGLENFCHFSFEISFGLWTNSAFHMLRESDLQDSGLRNSGCDYCEIHESAISADNSQEVGYCGVPAVLPNENLFENLPVRSYHTQKQEEMMERAHLEQQGKGQFHTIYHYVSHICLFICLLSVASRKHGLE